MNAPFKLPYVKRMVDRHGTVRHYFNRKGCPCPALPGAPGSPEFMAAYQRALEGNTGAQQAPPADPVDPPPGSLPGTFSELVMLYYSSPKFLTLAPYTQYGYRNIIERLRNEHGEKPLAMLDRKGVQFILAAKVKTPGAHNKTLRMLRMLMGFAIEEELRKDDPTARIKPLKIKGDGFRMWKEHHIAAFEAFYPVGTRERLALGLLLYTAQRRADVIRLGRANIQRGFICLKQRKTGTYLEIPVLPELTELLRTAPVGPATFLITQYGRAFTDNGFGVWFGNKCAKAGLVGFSAHGLRKASMSRLAYAGCSANEIMAISGHKNMAEVALYTRQAEQPVLATAAMARLSKRPTG